MSSFIFEVYEKPQVNHYILFTCLRFFMMFSVIYYLISYDISKSVNSNSHSYLIWFDLKPRLVAWQKSGPNKCGNWELFISINYCFHITSIPLQEPFISSRDGSVVRAVASNQLGTLSSGNADGDGNAETCEKAGRERRCGGNSQTLSSIVGNRGFRGCLENPNSE